MKLSEIQSQLKAPKGQFNSFAKYKYRSCEDILEAVKPLLGEASLTLTDEIVMVGERYYVKATATYRNGENISSVAYAREPLSKKGMDESQITGTASSYARKYALNGLFCIDDAKDADTDEHKHQEQNAPAKKPETKKKTKAEIDLEKLRLKDDPTKEQWEVLAGIFGSVKDVMTKAEACVEAYKLMDNHWPDVEKAGWVIEQLQQLYGKDAA